MTPDAPPTIHAFILAGGLSSRMGRDKARLKLGSATMLELIRSRAEAVLPCVRVVRHDVVPRCGPLGGIITAFRRSRADAILFLACDMPQVTSTLLTGIVNASLGGRRSVFSECDGWPGFPFLLPRSSLPVIEQQRTRGEFSLRALADTLEAERVIAPAENLVNVNSPDDYRKLLADG